MSNAIGSNVFDINLGIGLPFLIRIAIDHGAPISLLDKAEWVSVYLNLSFSFGIYLFPSPYLSSFSPPVETVSHDYLLVFM